MNMLVEEWFNKANKDIATAVALAKTTKNFDEIIGFHCQQCVEKYLKGFLLFHKIPFRKTHSIEELWNQCNKTEDFTSLKEITGLTVYAVSIRYPGDEIVLTEDEIEEIIELCKKTIKLVNLYLSEDRLL